MPSARLRGGDGDPSARAPARPPQADQDARAVRRAVHQLPRRRPAARAARRCRARRPASSPRSRSSPTRASGSAGSSPGAWAWRCSRAQTRPRRGSTWSPWRSPSPRWRATSRSRGARIAGTRRPRPSSWSWRARRTPATPYRPPRRRLSRRARPGDRARRRCRARRVRRGVAACGGRARPLGAAARGAATARPARRTTRCSRSGGAAHPDQEALHPWLRTEISLLGELLAAGTPVLGVCLGAELLAAAAGGGARAMRRPEVGWYDVSASPRPGRRTRWSARSRRSSRRSNGTATGWRSLPVRRRWRAARRARRRSGSGSAAWGIQFHAEVTLSDLTAWIDQERSPGGGRAAGVRRGRAAG